MGIFDRIRRWHYWKTYKNYERAVIVDNKMKEIYYDLWKSLG